MLIQKNIILIWAGTNASIPAGFVRATELDGKFPKGSPDNTSQNSAGGADQHTHTSPAHAHNLQNHNHSFDLTNIGHDTDDCGGSVNNGIVTGTHQHNGCTTDSMATFFSSSDSLTYGAVAGNSLPPYNEVIFIKCSNSAILPTGVIGLLHDVSANLASNWNLCDGLSGRPNLQGKFLRGAATSGNAGATGGANTHSHVMTHTHVSGANHQHHAHSSTNGGGLDRSDGSGVDVSMSHQHNFYTDFSVAQMDTYTATNALSDSVEPQHMKLHAVRNAGVAVQIGLIGLFTAAKNLIPAGWFICDGQNGTPDLRNMHVKVALNDTEMGTIAGNDTHTHAGTSHQHSVSAGHTHTGTSDPHNHDRGIDGVSSDHTDRNPEQHNIMNCQSVAPLHDAATTTADAGSTEPAYLTTFFIQFQRYYGGVQIIDG